MSLRLEPGRVTIYSPSMSGICVVEASAFASEVAPHAQYGAAVHYAYVPRVGRVPKAYAKGYRPDLVVIDGWDHPVPTGGIEDFSAAMDAHIAATGARVVVDYRGHDSKDRFAVSR